MLKSDDLQHRHWHTAHLAMLALHHERAKNNHQNGQRLEDFLSNTPGLVDQVSARIVFQVDKETTA